MFQQLNTKSVGIAGLLTGSGAIIASVVALFKLLSDPTYLVTLYWAISHIKHHAFGNADVFAIAQLGGALVGILGAFVLAILASYFGRPITVEPSAPPAAKFGKN